MEVKPEPAEASRASKPPWRSRLPHRRAAAVCLVIIVVVALAVGAYCVVTRDDGSSAAGGSGQSQSGGVPPIVDSTSPVRAYVQGTYRYDGPGGSFTQSFAGSLNFSGTCAEYGKSGFGGRFETPYALYPAGTKLDHSLTGTVTVREYRGPRTYQASDLTGELGARDGSGTSVGFMSVSSPAQVTVTVKPDGAGEVTFAGRDLGNLKVQAPISGSLAWNCQDVRLKVGAYSLNAY
jgi:hypothetical protein